MRVIRTVLALTLALLLSALAAEVQSSGRVRIGWLSTAPHPFINAFRIRLRDLGYVDSQSVIIEVQYAGGQPDRLQGGLGIGLALVRHLVQLHGGSVFAESPGEG